MGDVALDPLSWIPGVAIGTAIKAGVGAARKLGKGAKVAAEVAEDVAPTALREASNAARTCNACSLTGSLNRDGLERGRRDRGSSTAAGPSTTARLRSS